MTPPATPAEPGADSGEPGRRPPIGLPATAGRARPPRAWRTPVALVALALLAGSAGGLAEHGLDQLRQPRPAATASPTAIPPASQPAGPALDVAVVVARVGPAIVTIHGQVAQGLTTGTVAGTGIVIAAGGEVLTNAHLVLGTTSLQVTVGGRPRPARVVGASPAADIALLRVSGVSGLATADLGTSADVHVGDDVVVIGNALDLGGAPTVTRGIVSAIDRSFGTGNRTMTGLIQTDAALSSGSTGGALVNARGQVIGVTTMTADSTQGTSVENVNLAIPIGRAMSIVDSFTGAR